MRQSLDPNSYVTRSFIKKKFRWTDVLLDKHLPPQPCNVEWSQWGKEVKKYKTSKIQSIMSGLDFQKDFAEAKPRKEVAVDRVWTRYAKLYDQVEEELVIPDLSDTELLEAAFNWAQQLGLITGSVPPKDTYEFEKLCVNYIIALNHDWLRSKTIPPEGFGRKFMLDILEHALMEDMLKRYLWLSNAANSLQRVGMFRPAERLA
jgi:hypothetical protein